MDELDDMTSVQLEEWRSEPFNAKIAQQQAEIERLRNDLAEVDELLAALAYSSPRDRWPKGSVLGKAMDRHRAALKDTTP